MKISLKTKLVTIFLVLITVPLSLLGSISYNMSSSALQTTTEEELRVTTAQTAKAINSTIDSVNGLLKATSYNADLLQAIANSSDVNNMTSSFNYLAQIKKENKATIESLVLVDVKGKGILSSETITVNLDISDRAYFQKALIGEQVISDVLLSKLTNKPVIAMAYPLKQGDKIIGALVGTILFETISKQAAELKVGKSGYAYMIDKTGLIVYHPVADKVMKENAGDTNSKELKAYVEQMKSGKTGDGLYTYEGVKKYVRFEPAGNWVIATTAAYNDYMSAALDIRKNTIILVFLSIVFSMVIAYLFTTRNIINPVKKLQKQMDLAGQGDLTAHIELKTGDEIQALGDSFNSMILNQEEIVSKVRESSKQLALSSDEMASSAQEISAAAEEISSSIQEVAVGAEKQNESVIDSSQVLVHLSSLVQLAQNKAVDAENNAENSKGAAKYGRSKVQETVNAMNIINKGTNETSAVLKVVNELSIKVENIISVINSIAEQTNLLALNASIEAARAGEHGKGFAVVADEVRKLAEESNSGATEISTLVATMVSEIGKAVASMNSTASAVTNGVKVVEDTDNSFVNIMNVVEQITNNIREIVAVTKDEVATSDEIIKLIDTMGTISESTAANSEHVSSASEEQTATVETLAATSQEVSSMASELESIVEKFKTRR
jgi:methyl-accepting chemotaxis protein